MYDNEIKKEYALLVSVDTGEFDAEVSINELEELAHTAGAEVVGKVIQKKEAPEKATFVGVGKLAEIIAFCETQEVDLLIFDSELSPSQQRNLEKLTGIRVSTERCSFSIFLRFTRSAARVNCRSNWHNSNTPHPV